MQQSHDLPRRGQLVVIADEVSALGFRLSGIRVVVPSADGIDAAFDAALADAALVLVTAGLARRLPARSLAQAGAAVVPAVVIVADLRDEHPMPDTGARVRAQLAAGT